MLDFTTLQSLAVLLSILCGYLITRQLKLSQLLQDKQSQHLVFGSAASLFVLWMFRTGIYDGLSVHFLWLAALPLLLGFRWAICSATITLLGVTAFGKEPLTMLGVNFLLGVLAPISLTYACYTLMVRILPRNRFVYVLCGAFIPGALALGLKMLSLSAYYYVDDIFAWSTISDKYLMLTSLLMMPEAMFNAMTVLLLVLYKPQWLYTYHHKMYLGK